MDKKTIKDFKKLLDVNTPIICINDFDYRVNYMIAKAAGMIGPEPQKYEIEEWNPALHEVKFPNFEQTGNESYTGNIEDHVASLTLFLSKYFKRYKLKTLKHSIVILREIQDLIDAPSVKTMLQLIAQRQIYDCDFDVTIIIVCSIVEIPEELEKFVSYLEIPLVEEKGEVERLIQEHLEQFDIVDDKTRDSLVDEFSSTLRGMSSFEIDRMLDKAISYNGHLAKEDREMILQQKKVMVKNSGVLELIETTKSLDCVGGVGYMKNYLKKKSYIIDRLSKGKVKNLIAPKGIFIVGMPGCGKSLCAKATAKEFGVPLLKLDMGSLMDKYVGGSEKKLRKALQVAEATAPCVLWIDEIEKAFGGVGGQNSEVLTRMFGHFLSWMQEKKSLVYVVAAANRADNIPPELKRKGRFDELFCVNLPSKEEVKQILDIKLKERGYKPDQVALSQKAMEKMAGKFCGADIEAVVNEATENEYLDSIREELADAVKDQVDRDLSFTQRLEKEIDKAMCISDTCSSQIEEMKKLFLESRFVDATNGPQPKKQS